LPGEFLEADRKRKEEQEAVERKPVLLVENESDPKIGGRNAIDVLCKKVGAQISEMEA
jgi:hypothetical protein